MKRVMDAIVRARQRLHGIARQLARIGEILAHRHHFPIELVALGSAVIVEARLGGLDEARDAHLAALEPIVLQQAVRLIADPVEAEGLDDLGLVVAGRALEETDDVLLPIGDGEAAGVGEDHRMNAEADARRLGDVFQQIHLLAVESDAIDLIALAPDRIEHSVLADLRRNAVNQNVLPALR